MPRLLGSHIARSPATISDKHRLFWNSFRIPGGPPPNDKTHRLRHTIKKYARSPTSSKTNPPKINTKPTCKTGSPLIHVPLEPNSIQNQPANTSNKSAKPPPKLASAASSGNTKDGSPTGTAGPHICWPTKRTTTSYSKYNATFSANMDTRNGVHLTCSTMCGHSLSLGKKQSIEHSAVTKTPKQFNATST